MTDVEKKRALTELEKAEIEEELQRILEENPEAFEEVFGPKQPFDSNTRPWEIFECKTDDWGVVFRAAVLAAALRPWGPSLRRKTRWHSLLSTRQKMTNRAQEEAMS